MCAVVISIFMVCWAPYHVYFILVYHVPSITKYLERAVMVEISKIPEANNGQPIVEPILAPAITFCPFKNLK